MCMKVIEYLQRCYVRLARIEIALSISNGILKLESDTALARVNLICVRK